MKNPALFVLALLMTLIVLSELPKATRQQKTSHLRMAVVNVKSLSSDGPAAKVNQANIAANLKRHFYFIDRLVEEKVDFVGFGELSINGYHFSKNMTWLIGELRITFSGLRTQGSDVLIFSVPISGR